MSSGSPNKVGCLVNQVWKYGGQDLEEEEEEERDWGIYKGRNIGKPWVRKGYLYSLGFGVISPNFQIPKRGVC